MAESNLAASGISLVMRLNAPADSPERIAEILREILALAGSEGTWSAPLVEPSEDRDPAKEPEPNIGSTSQREAS
jgi:hypothetical protein